MCQTLEPGYWCADNDCGEHFLNFPLHPNLQQYCGLDLSKLYPEKMAQRENLLTAVWVRNVMGLKQSPYASVQGALRAKARLEWNSEKEMLTPSIGTRSGGTTQEVMNMILGLAWIAKVDEEGWLATELHQYVDDIQITAKTKEMAWQASSRVAKVGSCLGLQDAAHKRREPRQQPGPWAGAVVSTKNGKVCQSVTQEHWDKLKTRVRWLAKEAGVPVVLDQGDLDPSEEARKKELERPLQDTPTIRQQKNADEIGTNYGGWTQDLLNALSKEQEAYNLLLSVEGGVARRGFKPGMDFLFSREGLKYVKIHNDLGEANPYPAQGPWDVCDDRLGYRAAIGMVISLDEGMYANYIQYETKRRLRSDVSNFEHTTPGGVGAAFVGEEGRVSFMSNA
eukprot:CAMPEP_0178911038 /NCGR_PEP_ID=MMETSP0786-20121207/9447_1 /TAXON_ID=186022 /ORGANISM="Thalassionema frauenfeldii, Strain CCMP 1798" /LENGTH=393 /DNA_ID=CAMNT_0020583389 /DNA_START=728 /DNA_END=1911 /DNA_ORIENTATION=+